MQHFRILGWIFLVLGIVSVIGGIMIPVKAGGQEATIAPGVMPPGAAVPPGMPSAPGVPGPPMPPGAPGAPGGPGGPGAPPMPGMPPGPGAMPGAMPTAPAPASEGLIASLGIPPVVAGVILIVLGIAVLLAGIGLVTAKPWARTLGTVLGSIALLVGLFLLFRMNFFGILGLAVGIYTLWVLMRTGAEEEWDKYVSSPAKAPAYKP